MRLHAVEAGEGPTLVLLHGLFGSAQNFGGIQRRLADGFRVIAIDLRNHGASPHAPDMSYPAMAADVLETLRAGHALPCMLVGHSMGGKVAMRAALDDPAAIARLVVSDIAPVRYPPAFGPYVEAMRALALPPGLSRAQASALLAPAIPDPGIRGFLLQNLRFAEAPEWRIGLAEISAALPVIEGWEMPEAAAYDGPALFVSGERSDYIRVGHHPVIRVLFPAAAFVTVPGAGHWVHADNPDGFVRVLRSFLGR